jgi:hypothetical protein
MGGRVLCPRCADLTLRAAIAELRHPSRVVAVLVRSGAAAPACQPAIRAKNLGRGMGAEE